MKIGIEYAIQALVESLLLRQTPEDIGYHIQVDGSYTFYREHSTKEHNFSANFIFQRPMNYTKVFFHQSDRSINVMSIPKDAWKLKADHDSCWLSDGVGSTLNNIHWEMMRKFTDEERPKVHEFIRFGMGSGKFCSIKVEPNPKKGTLEFKDKYTLWVGKTFNMEHPFGKQKDFFDK